MWTDLPSLRWRPGTARPPANARPHVRRLRHARTGQRARAAGASRRVARAAVSPHFAPKREAARLPLHERRAVARGHLRSQSRRWRTTRASSRAASFTRRPRAAASCRRRSPSGGAGRAGSKSSETLPHLASVIDDCCIIRSMHTDVPNHEPALLQMHTGNLQPIRPSLGSWLLYGLGTENENLPGYIVLRPSSKIVVGPALWSNGFLPAEYQATSVLTADMAVDKLVANIRNPRLGRERAARAARSARAAERASSRGSAPATRSSTAKSARWRRLFTCRARRCETFDISREPAAVREAYGETPFARSCLLARRLLEDGVRVVSVYYTSGGQSAVGHARESQRAAPQTLRRCRPRRGCADRGLKAARHARRHAGRLGRRVRPHAHTPRHKDDKSEGRPRPSSHRLLDAARRRRREGRAGLRRDR